MTELEEKIKAAQETLKLAAEMSDYYYHAPLILCYSGGKDSDVMLDIAKRCLKPDEFEVFNSHTTVDAPDTVYHIRTVFKELEALGIKTTIKMPTYKGEPTSMWKLIVQKGAVPTRLMRFCCEVLKETNTPNRMIATGVREDESDARKDRGTFGEWTPRRKSNSEYRSLQHTYAMFKLDKLDQDTYECKMIEACKKNKDTVANPIYYFTEEDIWEYVKTFDVPVNPLYAKGYKRVGCVGCPLASSKEMNRELNDFPIYKQNYIKTFDRLLEKKRKEGKEFLKGLSTGEEVMRWWLGEDPKQVRIDDILDNDML